ncbi:MAG: acyl carrier protein [Kiritimatiellia bacterium]|nr:acyl carrier protein [Kiritimatiellia bacterium]
MMSEESIESRLKKMIVERLFMKISPDEIEDEKSLINVYGVDSVSLLELVVGIEEEFGIEVEDEDFDVRSFETVAALSAFVQRKMG